MFRIKWLDTARGGSILLVVAYHATLYASAYGFDVDLFEKINAALSPIRMPLFFTVSGILSAKAMSLSWDKFLAKRIWLYVWLFLVWLTIRWFYFRFIQTNILNPAEGSDAFQLVTAWFSPESGIWFLWALLIFHLMARACATGARMPLIAVSVVISAMAFGEAILFDNFAQQKALCYAPFFFTGAYFNNLVEPITQRPKQILAASAVLFALLFVAGNAIPMPYGGIILLARSVAGVGLACAIAVLIQDIDWLNAPLAYLGRNTLPIYVAHIMIVSALCQSLMPFSDFNLIDLAVVPLAVAVSVVLTLIIKAGLDAIGARYLYTAPGASSVGEPAKVRNG